MAITEAYTGTSSITVTEWSAVNNSSTIAADTSDGIFQGFFDVSDMVAGDWLQLRVYEKVRTGDTQRLVYESLLSGVQSYPLVVIPSLVLMNGWDFTMKCLAGTSITVNWSIRKVA